MNGFFLSIASSNRGQLAARSLWNFLIARLSLFFVFGFFSCGSLFLLAARQPGLPIEHLSEQLTPPPQRKTLSPKPSGAYTPPFGAYKPPVSKCIWSSHVPPSDQSKVSSSPRIAVCLAGAFRTIVSPIVTESVRKHIRSLGRGVHVFAVGQLGTEINTGKHEGHGLDVENVSLHNAFKRLQPICVRHDERRPPCSGSSCTGQWNKWSECVQLVKEFAAAESISYDFVVKLRFDQMLGRKYPSLRAIGVFTPEFRHTTFMDRDAVIIWPWVMLDAIAAMPSRASCEVGSRCSLEDYGNTRPTCSCLATTYFEDAFGKQGTHKEQRTHGAPRVIDYAKEDSCTVRGPPFTVRSELLRLKNASSLLNICADSNLMERLQNSDCGNEWASGRRS